MSDGRDLLRILVQRAALEHPTFPGQPWIIPSPREVRSTDSGLPRDTLNSMGTSGNFFWKSTCSRRTILLTPLSEEEECGSCEVRQYLLHALVRALHSWILTDVLEELSLWYDGLPRFQISEMHLGKFFWLKECQSWKFHYKTEVCSKSAEPQLTMQWIKEVEIATSIDDPMTSRSITDYDMLDAMIASALKKVLTHVQLWKRASVEEQRAQKTTDSYEGDEIACMICEHFRATVAYGSSTRTQICSTHMLAESSWFPRSMELCSIIRKRSPYRNGSGRFIQVKIAGFCSASDGVGYTWTQENIRNNGQPSCSRLKIAVRRQSDQVMRKRNLRARNEVVERGGTVIESHKGKKANVERRVGECYQWKANGRCSKGQTCGFRHEPASGNRCVGGTKRTIVLSSSKSEGTDWREDTVHRFSWRKVFESSM